MAYKDVVKREIERFSKSPLAWIISFFFPLIMCIIICLIFAKASPTDLPIAVYNADNSQISRTIVRDLNTLQSCHVKYRTTNLEEGHQLLIEGKIYGFVVIEVIVLSSICGTWFTASIHESAVAVERTRKQQAIVTPELIRTL